MQVRTGTLQLILLLALPLPTRAEDTPNGSLKVAYRMLEDGKLSDSVHQIELQCWNSRCSLTTVTLNQCLPFSAGPAFYPKVERSATDDGDLSIASSRPGGLDLRQEMAGTTTTYRLTFTVRQDAALAQRLRSRGTTFFSDLVAFSGVAVRNSGVLQKVLSWELVPLKGHSVQVEPLCKIQVDGLGE